MRDVLESVTYIEQMYSLRLASRLVADIRRATAVVVSILAVVSLIFGTVSVAPASAVPIPGGEAVSRGEVPFKVKTWSKLAIPSPNKPAGMHNELINIDCQGLDCAGVGLWGPSADVSKPTVMKLRGKRATTKAIPGVAVGNLAYGISCVTKNWCMVVGNTHKDTPSDRTWSILMKQNKWKKKSTLTPSNGAGGQAYLFDVKCLSTKYCVAVGQYFDPKAEMHGLVLQWNGKSWRRILSSKFGGASLQGLDCTGINQCVVVGSTSKGAASWRLGAKKVSKISGTAKLPFSRFNKVDCVTSSWCAAVGVVDSKPLAAQITGSRWRRVSVGSNTKSLGELADISCSAVKRCTAASSWQDSQRFSHAAVWRWRDSSRKLIKLPGYKTTVGSLNTISCQRARCVAAGQNYIKGDMGYQLLNTAYQGPPN